MAYVWATSNHTMPTPYKVAAWEEGARLLLLWSWLLSTYAAVIVFPESPQVPRHDAVRGRGFDVHPDLLPDPERIRRESL
jgi:cytochrome c biogenesis factor